MFEKYPDVVTVRELCQMLQIGRNTAYDLIHTGKIESITLKTQIRIPKINVINFLQSKF